MNERLIGVNYLIFMILNDLSEKYDLFDLEVLCEELIIDEGCLPLVIYLIVLVLSEKHIVFDDHCIFGIESILGILVLVHLVLILLLIGRILRINLIM
jgi:hypothetical protein